MHAHMLKCMYAALPTSLRTCKNTSICIDLHPCAWIHVAILKHHGILLVTFGSIGTWMPVLLCCIHCWSALLASVFFSSLPPCVGSAGQCMFAFLGLQGRWVLFACVCSLHWHRESSRRQCQGTVHYVAWHSVPRWLTFLCLDVYADYRRS